MRHSQHLILTPNARLARSLQYTHAKQAASDNQTAWEKPAILPIQIWLSELHQAWVLQAETQQIPLDSQQARLMWQRAIDDEIVMSRSGLAKLAMRAWQCIHEHELKSPDQWPQALLNDDQRAFKRWAKRYQRICRDNHVTDLSVDLAALAEACAERMRPLPDHITLHGFVQPVAPAHQRILDAIEHSGCAVSHRLDPPCAPATPMTIHGCPTPDDEIIHAAHWARAHLQEHPDHTIAIVVPDLGQRVARLERLLRAVLDPPSACLEPATTPIWHVAYGHPLGQLPMVGEALALLALRPEKVTQVDVARLVQSPWLKGWPDEASQRQQMVLRLHDHEPHWVDVPTTLRYAHAAQCPALADILKTWQQRRRRSPQTAHTDAWAEQFQEELSAIGFGFGRTLDATEYQILNHWHQALEQFSRLSALSRDRATRYGRPEALALLTTLAKEVMFREQDPGAPLSVLSVDEALGSRFDAVWLAGVDEETWPARPERIPLIPAAIQSKLEAATPEGAVALAKRQLEALITMAPDVRASHPLGNEDWALKPTRLITEHREHTSVWHEDAVPAWSHPNAILDVIENDSQAPPLPHQEITKGGVRLLNDQSACPFKAFATHRLGAKGGRLPRPGIGPKDRGILIHQALDSFWAEIADSHQLNRLDQAALETRVGAHVDTVLNRYQQQHPAALDGMMRSLERHNLSTKVLEWLDIEKARPAFSVIQREEKNTLTIGPLKLTGQPDRVDQLASGERIIVDYKSGKTSKTDWQPGERLTDGQLPAYALNLNPPAQGIAFGKLAKDHISFDGLAAHDLDINGIKPIEKYNYGGFKTIKTWPDLLDAWRDELAQLAEEYQQGHAPVAPASDKVCRNCHLKSVCRIGQRSAWSDHTSDAQEVSNE